MSHHKNLINNRESLENRVIRREENLKFLDSQANRLKESILDLQVSLARYHSTNEIKTENGNEAFRSEEETVEQILNKQNSAAGILCWLKANTLIEGSNLTFIKDLVGVVVTLARVESDNLSRILSEYLGLETMLAIVCKTSDEVKLLEKYDAEGKISGDGGFHGLGSSIGRKITGRFVVICLEELRPFVGDVAVNDPQRRLALPKPKLQNGECPPGFIDYAVNMVHLDSQNLSFVTSSGHGLRETLFYSLFSHLQIYKTRKEMLLALPCINDGALSLDGGMIKKCGMFALGSRKEVEVKFPLASGKSDVPENYNQAQDILRMLKWESSKLAEDIEREQQILDSARAKLLNPLLNL